jgi:Flp pilus assembly protein TadG
MNLLQRIKLSADFAVFRTADSIRRFARAKRGVAAVEFAFIAPIMILLFVGTIELSAGVATNRKLSRTSSAIGDLITQSQQLTCNDVENIMDVSSKIMYPYKDPIVIVISVVDIKNGQAKVAKSVSRPAGNEYATGSLYPVPDKIKKDNTVLVAAKVTTTYTPSFGWAHFSEEDGIYFSQTPIPMDEELFLRPRIGGNVQMC